MTAADEAACIAAQRVSDDLYQVSRALTDAHHLAEAAVARVIWAYGSGHPGHPLRTLALGALHRAENRAASLAAELERLSLKFSRLSHVIDKSGGS